MIHARHARQFVNGVDSRMYLACAADDNHDVMSVLIVDDHPAYRASARRLLEAEGFDVIGEAGDGHAGIAAVRELHPDLVLLDVQLPDIDGFEVAARIAALGLSSAVVLVSSRNRAEYGALVTDSAVRGFVPKAELSGAALTALMSP
jgi:DNA-binding NarL/FixJ family response regulator